MGKLKLSERYTKAPRFFTIEPYLRPVDHPIASHPDARKPRLVPLVILDYGSFAARLKQMRFISKYLVKGVYEVLQSARSIKQNPYTGKTTIDAPTLAELEAYARSLGATDIGYTEVNTRYIFRGFRILYKHAIVFTMEMDREKIRQAPAVPSFIEIFRTYLQLGVIVNRIAAFLRERGYNAHAGPALGGDLNYIPLARDAGLGEVGKNGLLITRNNGPRVRLAAVYTDIENLPFAPQNNEYRWIRAYCDTCNICHHKCPAGAYFPEPVILEDGGPTFIDHTLCAEPFSRDNGCTLCIKFCPFSYGEYDKIKARYEASMRVKEQA